MAGKIVADTLEHSTAGSIATNYVVDGSAKAWMHMPNGAASTISLSDSLNTSGITDGGTGIYTPSWTNSMSNATYGMSLSTQRGVSFSDHPSLNSMASGSMQIAQSSASAYVNSVIYTASIHGDLA